MVLNKRIKLILEDSSVFEGYSFGAERSVSGEVVFNTGMVGYPESLTDPSYNGQILTLTYPLIGNYGVPESKIDKYEVEENFESDKIQVKALIVSDYSSRYSHWDARKSLSLWLKEHNVPGIYDVDTRVLTKRLREKGVMLGKVVVEDYKKKIDFYDPNKTNLVAKVSRKDIREYGDGDARIVLIDCGCKNNIIRCLVKRNAKVIVVPWDYNFHKLRFDGLFLSNGPGDPKICRETIKNVKVALEKRIPIMGVCLGNQILALAARGNTYKLKYGHRSQNQPCVEVGSKKCYITSQNHGYAVDEKSLSANWEPWFRNANDNTNEGIRHKTKPFMSVQFHPEGTAGPVDTEFLFDDFLRLIK